MKKILFFMFILSLYLCEEVKVEKKQQKNKQKKKGSIFRKLSQFSSKDLMAYCRNHKKFCQRYHKEIFQQIVKEEKQHEHEMIKKMEDATEALMLKRQLNVKGTDKSIECVLSARIYPYIFWARTNSVEFKIMFRSSCLDEGYLMYFMIPWYNIGELSLEYHPTFVNLQLFGKDLSFKYTQPYKRGEMPNMVIAYQMCEVYPSKISGPVNTFADNDIIFHLVGDFFNKEQLKKIISKPNPYPCEVNATGQILNCTIDYEEHLEE